MVVLLAASCGNSASTRKVETDAGPALECGEGTIKVDGECRPKDELCNGIDDDGDGVTDEQCVIPPSNVACGAGTILVDGECVPLPNQDYDEDNDGFSPFEGDCNDDDPTINPTATEVCDELDNNCDGQVDEDDPSQDDFCISMNQYNGNYVAVQGTERCHGIAGMICTPLPVELCRQNAEICDNALDDNCDGVVDEGCDPDFDFDKDGFSPFDGDCDDDNRDIHPDAIESCNGLDDDCDGQIDEGYPIQFFLRDADGDGHGDPENMIQAADCLSAPYGYIDWIVDLDNDCDDSDSHVNPAAIEYCNNIDDDCDGATDEDDPDMGIACTAVLSLHDHDVPILGVNLCENGEMLCTPPPLEECQLQTEICGDIYDNNCDGQVDEDCEEDGAPHYCEPVYTNYGILIGYRGCCGASPLTTTHPEAGMLIKTHEYSSVYYYASDGFRYVFPTTLELDSWYSPLDEYGIPVSPNEEICQQVYDVSLLVLASIPMGMKNVTLRPGAFVTGSTTDSSQRYVVDHCATRKEVDPITVLDEIYSSNYGSTAWERTHPVWNVMWGMYTTGQTVTSADNFDWLETYQSATIEEELGISGMCVDQDGDGYSPFAGDCDDGNDSLFPGAQELCDGIDNNCDGETDEDFAEYLGQPCRGYARNGEFLDGYCSEIGTVVCHNNLALRCSSADENSRWTTDYNWSLPEVCGNSLDDNCDGQVDEGCDQPPDGVSFCEVDDDCADAAWGQYCVYSLVLDASFCQACRQDVDPVDMSQWESVGCGGQTPICAWGVQTVPVSDAFPDGYAPFYWCVECVLDTDCTPGFICSQDNFVCEQQAAAATLTVDVAGMPASGNTYVKGTDGVPAVGFIFTAGDSADALVNSVKLTVYLDNNQNGFSDTADVDDTSGAQNVLATVTIYDAGTPTTPLADAKNLTVNASDITVQFDSLNWTVPSGSTKALLVKATLSTTAPLSGDDDDFALTIQESGDVDAEDGNGTAVNVVLQNGNQEPDVWQTATGGGILDLTEATSTPVSSLLVAGTSNNLVSVVEFASTGEAFIVERMQVYDADGNGYDEIGAVRVSYTNSLGETEAKAAIPDMNGIAIFNNLDIYVPKDAAADVRIFTDLNTVAGSADNGDSIRLTVAESANFRAVGRESGVVVIDTAAAADPEVNSHYVFESVPSVAFAVDTPSGNLIPSANTLLAKLAVTADGAKDITFDAATGDITFKISSSCAGTATGDVYLKDADGTTLATPTAIAPCSATSVKFLFEDVTTDWRVPAGETKYLYVWGDTSMMTSQGDSIQLWLDDASNANFTWSINGIGTYQHADILFRGDKYGGLLLKP
ncbi:MAG TPA: MopE-related protein [Candidatus Bipolaricaulota bacterium]|nr:MopE-related protein [Candidatus Bipolaricaulota bacterium]